MLNQLAVRIKDSPHSDPIPRRLICFWRQLARSCIVRRLVKRFHCLGRLLRNANIILVNLTGSTFGGGIPKFQLPLAIIPLINTRNAPQSSAGVLLILQPQPATFYKSLRHLRLRRVRGKPPTLNIPLTLIQQQLPLHGTLAGVLPLVCGN